jgi:hypothetical protein
VAQISPGASETKTSGPQTKTLFLGPFVGDITGSSVKIWLNIQEAATDDLSIYVTLEAVKQGPANEEERLKRHPKEPLISEVKGPKVLQAGVVRCLKSDLGTGVATIGDLNANTQYSYRLWQDEAHTVELNLNPSQTDNDNEGIHPQGLQPKDLFSGRFPMMVMDVNWTSS